MMTPDAPLFLPATEADWLRQVQRDLKDDSAPEHLRWQTPDGFVVEPYYTAEKTHSGEKPSGGETQNIASLQQKTTPGWLNAPEPILTSNAKANNATLRNALANGADALVLAVTDTTDFTRLLDGIKLSTSPIFFRVSGVAAATQLINSLKILAPYQLKGGLLFDPLAAPQPLMAADWVSFAELTRQTLDSPRFGTVCADGNVFHNAGATATQELAFVLNSLTEQYDVLTDKSLSVNQFVSKTSVSVSVGVSYFLEIAKLRALRVLVNRFSLAYSSPVVLGGFPQIHCQTSAFYEAVRSPYTNLLRATTAAMSAVLGGCDALTVRPYDAVTGNVSGQAVDFSARIARNVSSLLRHESYLGTVADPSAGSYYIETLAAQLVESAWALFLDVERRGGLAQAIQSGFVAAELDRSFQAKHDAVATGERVLVGVTKFRENERENEAVNKPTGHPEPGLVGNSRRLAESFE